MIQPKTLQQRIAIFILIPVFLILAGMGWISFVYARNALLKQWSKTAIVKLQRSAHMIDMRLSRPKDLLIMLKDNSRRNQSYNIQSFIIEQLKKMEGVVEVRSDLIKNGNRNVNHTRMNGQKTMPMHFNTRGQLQISSPIYNTRLSSETISLLTDFKDKSGKKVGEIEVVISFQDLIDQISKAAWWKSNKAFLIDNEGNILSATQLNSDHGKLQKFATTDLLEKKTMEALKNNPYGTIFGSGHPPEEVSGYYHLNEAPWSLVIISPGKRVLESIQKFRLYYFTFGFLAILGVILFIRLVITRTTNAIKKVSDAANNLANGIFVDQLPVTSKDEVGELTDNFNKMTKQLKERLELKEAMNLAMEVQQSLLPPAKLTYKNLEISGRAIYCDETGGDYFDIIEFPHEPGKVCVAVGDVVGHGIGAALLMATTRAFLRSQVKQKDSLVQIINSVNRLLCKDTHGTGRFVTLFVLIVDLNKNQIQWVRAGHEPAMIYNPKSDTISELKGKGLVLGLDENFEYTQNIYDNIPKGSVVLISTDGTWDVEDKEGNRFGKKRVVKILQKSNLLSPDNILDSIISETKNFRGAIRQNDDITLLALKFL